MGKRWRGAFQKTVTTDYAVILAARMSSGRLPGKALCVYTPSGQTNLEQLICRWQTSQRNPLLVVATSDGPEDDPIARLCAGLDVACYRAPRSQVIAREVLAQLDGALAAHAPGAKWIARATADNPLVDVGLADWRLDVLADSGADGIIYSGGHDRITYAATTDVYSRSAWERIVAGSSGSQREHPGAYFWENLHSFEYVSIPLPRREYLAPVRTELDTPADLEMFRALWAGYGRNRKTLRTLEALQYLAAHPEIAALNNGVHPLTQTRAAWPKGKPWLCGKCQRRVGDIVTGDLILHCSHCGRRQKWYSQPPRVRIPANIK